MAMIQLTLAERFIYTESERERGGKRERERDTHRDTKFSRPD
jgi:hypothetical protein